MRLSLQLSFAFCLLGLVSFNSSAQCTQKISDIPVDPVLLGFRLGMTKEQVKALVPQTHFGGKDDFGVSKTTINPFFDSTIDQTRFAGVRSVSLDFLDEQLTSIWIGYDETHKIQDVTEFANTFSDALKLPRSWSAYKGRGKQMRCSNFQLLVTTIAGGPSVRILDLTAEETIAARRQAKEENDSALETAAENGASEDTRVTADRKSRTYYPTGCEAAKEIRADNLLVFKSAEEAEKAGFKIAKGCN
jgi:hypothetical protein